jgi:hypothetical protein
VDFWEDGSSFEIGFPGEDDLEEGAGGFTG